MILFWTFLSLLLFIAFPQYFLCILSIFHSIFSLIFLLLDIWYLIKSQFPLISCNSFPFISLIFFFFPFARPPVLYLHTSGIYYFVYHFTMSFLSPCISIWHTSSILVYLCPPFFSFILFFSFFFICIITWIKLICRKMLTLFFH